MGSEVKPCPGCRGTEFEIITTCHGRGRTDDYNVECRCGVAGPWKPNSVEAIAAWNALPRWDWRPASQPPEVPKGEPGIWVLGRIPNQPHGHQWYDAVGGFACVRMTHWMPLPPGPGGKT